MVWLLWARFVVLALLAALVVSFAWMSRSNEESR
jgi:hypothetical protein